jgi:hypothetical protein
MNDYRLIYNPDETPFTPADSILLHKDDQTIGRTRIISNQLGYPVNVGGFECKDFDEAGLPVEVGG